MRLLLCLTMLVALCAPAAAQTQAGAIKAANVTGNVIRISANGTESRINNKEALLETDTVRTADNSSIVLVFANGASVHLGENSRLAIVEFKMDPLAEDVVVAALEREPSVSRTRLHLDYGEMVGNVKPLNTASSYDVNTPVGAAGIRGTTFRIKLHFVAGGQVSFVLSTLEGQVVFNGAIQTTGGETVAVNGGDEVSAIATTDATGAVTGIQVTNIVSISSEASAAINSAVTQAIQQAQQSTTFSSTEQQNSANNSSQQNQPDNQSNNNSPNKNNPNNPAPNPLNPQDRSG